MDPRTRRSPARFLAPVALIAFFIVLLMIISGSNSKSSSGSSTTPSSDTTTQTSTTKTTATGTTVKKSAKTGSTTVRTYTVKVGDTLGSIAAKTGISLAQIQTLNPDVDPHAMVAGQKIKLK